jgi:hypothetical protein
MLAIAEYLDDLREDAGVAWTRMPLVRDPRTREPLPSWLRTLVLRRDNFRCKWCGAGGRLEVDHIIPWTAGGPDASWNLRTLCHDCNQSRSNYRTDAFRRRVLPIVLTCQVCDGSVSQDDGSEYASAWCAACGGGTPSSEALVIASPANSHSRIASIARWQDEPRTA